MRKNIFHITLLAFGLQLLSTLELCAQRYPATTSIQLIPPYSINLADYATAGTDRLLATVVFNDFSQSSWEVKFRFTIEGGSVKLQTDPEAPFIAINLTPGAPEQFTGFDLADYLNYNNMLISGTTHEEIIRKGGLPEGFYTFTLEALDYRTSIAISNKATSNAWLILNDPPQITFPMCGDRIAFTDPQNISFQWLPMHLSSPNSSFSTEYEFTIVELPDGLNANEAILSGMPILTTTESTNNFLYSISEPLLENGKNYAFRIRAFSGDELSLFKNEGYSQVCWFTYGYSTNGSIGVTRPLDGVLLNVNAAPVFGWNAPSNLSANQPVSYELKIFELPEGMDPAAMVISNAPPLYEETTPESPGSIGFAKRLDTDLDPQKIYVWQVKAFTSGIEIASTPALRFSTTPVVQQFNAGQHIIRIVSITNQDLENFSGKGRVKILKDGAEAEFDFSGLKIIAASGKLLLSDGEINSELSETFEDIELSPNEAVNGNAFFRAKALRITKNEMSISGTVEWALPFPVISGQQAWVRSELNYVNFDNLKLNGYIKLDNSNFFNLLDPFGFDLKLLAGSSNFFIRENQFTQNFDGEVTLPENVKSQEASRVKTSFRQVQQLFFNETEGFDKPITLVKNLSFDLAPRKITIDFSGQKSPEKLTSSADWKGVYFNAFDAVLKQQFDPHQLRLKELTTIPYMLTASDNFKAWVDMEGLDLSIDKTFEQETSATFNQFSGKLLQMKLTVENSQVSDGEVEGSIVIPFLDGKSYGYTIAVSNEGFEEGYLKEELAGKSFTLDTGTPNEVQFTIEQATFANNERLDMTIGLVWSSLSMQAENIDGFKVWGSGQIGFNEHLGKKALATRPEGNLKSYPIVATHVGAGYHQGKYFINTDTEISISTDLSGPAGPTTVSLYSISEPKDKSGIISGTIGTQTGIGQTNLSGNIKYNYNLIGSTRIEKDGMLLDSSFVKMDVFIGSFEGYIKFTENDPDWGNCWQGSFAFNLRIPVIQQIGVTYITGRAPDGFDYWFVDVSNFSVAADKESDSKLDIKGKAGTTQSGGKKTFEKSPDGGTEIKMGALSITGLQIRLYKHMRHSEPGAIAEGGQGLEVSFEPDASVIMGGMGRLAMADAASGGDILKLDVALEIVQLASGKYIYGFEGSLDTEMKAVELSGTGKFTYNEEEEHFIGDFWVDLEAKAVCLSAGLGLDMKPGYWKVSIGTAERKVLIIPGCQGWGVTGYLIFDPNEFELGLGLGFSTHVESGNIEIIGNKFNARADFGFSAGIMAAVQVKPEFWVKKAGVWADVWASVSVEYTTWVSSGIWTLASISLSGNMTMYFEEKTRIEGSLDGEVEVIGISVEFEMSVNHTFS